MVEEVMAAKSTGRDGAALRETAKGGLFPRPSLDVAGGRRS